MFHFDKMKNSIPSSIVILDKDNNVINWNKKAEEILGLEPESSKGLDVLDLDLMKKERILEKMKQFKRDRQPIKVRSISVRNKKGDIRLTDFSQTPLLDNNGDFHGSIMMLDDVSEREGIQAELQRKHEDLQKLDSKFQDVYTRLKLVNEDKLAADEHLLKVGKDKQRELRHVANLLEEKQQELEGLNNSISLKNGELEDISTKIEESRSNLQMVETELARRKTELETTPLSDDELSKTWKEKLKIYDEIDKSLSPTDEEPLKTKKIPNNKDTESE